MDSLRLPVRETICDHDQWLAEVSPLRQVSYAASEIIELGMPKEQLLFENLGDPTVYGWGPPPLFATLVREKGIGAMTPEEQATLSQFLMTDAVERLATGKKQELLEVLQGPPERVSDQIRELIGDLKIDLVSPVLRASDAAIDYRRFGYAKPAFGIPEARQWVMDRRKRIDPESTLRPEDVMWVDGTSDGLNRLYEHLAAGAMIIEPAPGYPGAASLLRKHTHTHPIHYPLLKENRWQPDLERFRWVMEDHASSVVGVKFEVCGNPTGHYIDRTNLVEMLKIMKRFAPIACMFVDDLYEGLHHQDDSNSFSFVDLAHEFDVPLILLWGASKTACCPGWIRTGIVEAHYSPERHSAFHKYWTTVRGSMDPSLGANVLQQRVLPAFFDHPEFPEFNRQMREVLRNNATELSAQLNAIPGLTCLRPEGGFYLSPFFTDRDSLNGQQTLPIENPNIRAYVEQLVAQPGCKLDERFVYYLLGATGLAGVPLRRMQGPNGLRLATVLQRDPAKRAEVVRRLEWAVPAYLQSA